MPHCNENLLIKTYFQVAFLRTWFANNKVDKFTVSVWFKRQGEQFTPQGIVNNTIVNNIIDFRLLGLGAAT